MGGSNSGLWLEQQPTGFNPKIKRRLASSWMKAAWQQQRNVRLQPVCIPRMHVHHWKRDCSIRTRQWSRQHWRYCYLQTGQVSTQGHMHTRQALEELETAPDRMSPLDVLSSLSILLLQFAGPAISNSQSQKESGCGSSTSELPGNFLDTS
jgi:hypothetical protein